MQGRSRHGTRQAVSGPVRAIAGSLITAQVSVCCLSLGTSSTGHAAASAAAEAYRGRKVAEVLRGLAPQGITFIYNSQVLPDDTLIEDEPQSRAGIALAREILAPHGLALDAVAPGMYAVVRQSRANAPADTAVARTDAPIDEIVVQTSRYSLAASDTIDPHTFLTQQEVLALPRLADETLRAVQRLPGTASNGVSSLASIRGGAPNETAIVLDGLRLYEPFHLKDFLSPVSLLDSRLIAGSDIYLGGFPAPYGERMSAVIDARSIQPATPQYYELGLSLFHVNGMAHTAFGDERGHALLSLRRSNLSELATLAERDMGEPGYFDGFARIDYATSAADKLSLSALASRDRIDAVRDSLGERAFTEYRNNYVWGTWDRQWSERTSMRLVGSFIDVTNNRRGTVNDPGRRTGSVNDQRSFHIAGLRYEGEYVARTFAHRFGAELRQIEAEYDYSSQVNYSAGYPFPDSPQLTTSRTFTPAPHGYEGAAFWDTRLDLGKRWTVQLGLRLDTQTYDDGAAAEQWSPRLSVRYELGARTLLRATAGRYYQAQGINELQVEDGVNQFNRPQYADHVILGFEHAFTSSANMRIETYRKRYGRLSPRFENLFGSLVLLPEIEFDRVRLDPSTARAQGVELLLSWRPRAAWNGWAAYTWSQVRDRIDGVDVPRSWDQEHAVNFGLTWSSEPWSVTLAHTWHTGWPTTDLTLASTGSGTPQAVVGQRNARRLGNYHSLDFRAQRTFQLARSALDVFVEASNLTSRDNPCCTEYDVRFQNGTYTLDADRKNWLPLVPSFGVLWRFDPAR